MKGTWGETFRERKEDLRRIDQRLASLEQHARHPRLAMEADESADEKTRERTEGAAKAVQAMHRDNFSANRVQDGPATSITFGVKAEPPALPCRDNVSVENGAAAPKSCLSPLKMRTTTVAGGLLPTGKTSTATRTTFDQPTLRFYSTEETILRGHQFNTPCTTAASGGITCLLPPPAGGSLKQDWGKV